MRHLLFFSIAALLLASCKSPTAPKAALSADTTSIRELYPLAVGNYWMYHVQQFDTNGVQVLDTQRTTEIIGIDSVDGRKEYAVDYGDRDFSAIYFDSDSQLFIITVTSGNTSRPWPIFRYPMNIGERKFLIGNDSLLHHHEGPYIYDFVYLQFDGKDEKITTAAGTFSCYHFAEYTITFNNANITGPIADTNITDQYYAPGIGLVSERYYTTATGVAETPPGRPLYFSGKTELLSYRVY